MDFGFERKKIGCVRRGSTRIWEGLPLFMMKKRDEGMYCQLLQDPNTLKRYCGECNRRKAVSGRDAKRILGSLGLTKKVQHVVKVLWSI